MSKFPRPKFEHTFSIKVKGVESKELFEGPFVYKHPNIRMDCEISKTKAMLDGGIANLDLDTQETHRVLATLKHTLIEYPKWWEDCDFGYELYDANVISKIYNETLEFEKKLKKELYGEFINETEGSNTQDEPESSKES